MTPHQKIMMAAKKMRGLRLTEKEVFELSADDAIATCAENDDNNDIDAKAEKKMQKLCADKYTGRQSRAKP